jgi:hypothetical protein
LYVQLNFALFGGGAPKETAEEHLNTGLEGSSTCRKPGYKRKVHRITKRQLKRAANALADLVSALR